MAGTTRVIKAIYVNEIQLDQVEDYVYLCQRFTSTEKKQFFNQCILPAMMYGAEMENKLSVAQQNTT